MNDTKQKIVIELNRAKLPLLLALFQMASVWFALELTVKA